MIQIGDEQIYRLRDHDPSQRVRIVHCERVIGSIRRELPDHVLITGEAHARQALKTYEGHYNRHRPHQAHVQLPPEAQEHPTAVHDLKPRKLLRTRIPGGLINEYRHAA
jgi:hypothetical protein